MAEQEHSSKDKGYGILDIVVLVVLIISVRMIIELSLNSFYDRFGIYFTDFVTDVLRVYPVTLAMVIADVLLLFFGLKHIQYGTKVRLRISLELVGVVIVSLLGALAVRTVHHFTGNILMSEDRMFLLTWVTAMIFNGIIIAACDVFNYWKWSNRRALSREIEKRVKANYQYNILKSQLNPHFLFNSLNVLDYLIYTDQDRASAYVKKLAVVYRYLLDMESKPLVRLEEEVSFVRQYVELMQERFQSGLNFTMDIPEQFLGKRIMPCSVQMLIENAIKHNIANPSNVLNISVCIEGDEIVTRNNIQPKIISSGSSSGIGLNNTQRLYNMLFNKSIKVSDGGGVFEVRIPLID